MATTPDLPRSLTEFEQRFGDEDAYAEYLAAVRWPDGFVCPGCGGRNWELKRGAIVWNMLNIYMTGSWAWLLVGRLLAVMS